MNWANVFQQLVERRPELAFVLLAIIASLYVLWQIVRVFIAHLRVLEENRRADQAAARQHQEHMTDRMETAFEKVGTVIDKNTAALARVEVRLDEQQQQQQPPATPPKE